VVGVTDTLAAGSSFGQSLGDFFVQLLTALKPLFTVSIPIPLIIVLFLGICVFWAVKS
jgi:ATP/ADP translocase